MKASPIESSVGTATGIFSANRWPWPTARIGLKEPCTEYERRIGPGCHSLAVIHLTGSKPRS
jgi:hypothetical protein